MSGTDTNSNVLSVTDADGRPSLILYETMAGVIFHITPLSLPTLRAIQIKAQEMYPYPDPTPYQKPEENAFDPNQKTQAEDDPAYVQLCHEVDRARARWADRSIFDYAATMPKFPTRESLIDACKPQLERLRKIATLEDDDYESALFHCVLTGQPVNDPGQSDYARIIRLAIQSVALTAAEVSAGVRFFRPLLPK
jgi:hypothetical protein